MLPRRAKTRTHPRRATANPRPRLSRTPLTLARLPPLCPPVQIVAPGDSLTVPGEGLCGGELVLCFEIIFPTTLSMEQKKKIKALGM